MKTYRMPDVKSAVKRLRDLSAGVMHQDIGKSDLFRETADMLEWYDRELYAQKEKTRQLMWEVGWWKAAYEHRDIPVSNIVPDKTTEPHRIDTESPLMTE